MVRNAIGFCAAIGGGAFAVAVFALGFPDDATGLLVGGIGSVLMLIGGFGAIILDRRRDGRRTT